MQYSIGDRLLQWLIDFVLFAIVGGVLIAACTI